MKAQANLSKILGQKLTEVLPECIDYRKKIRMLPIRSQVSVIFFFENSIIPI